MNRKPDKIIRIDFTPKRPPSIVVGGTEESTPASVLKAPTPYAERLRAMKK